jgi:hypothetical protein
VDNLRQQLGRNISYGLVVGACLGLMSVINGPAALNLSIVLGATIGGALGGAVLFVLAAAVWRILFR